MRNAIFLLLVAVFVSGCAVGRSPGPFDSTVRPPTALSTKTILVMPLDVELSRLQASGLREPQAQWTADAKGHITGALDDYLSGVCVKLVSHGDELGQLSENRLQLLKLHEAVGQAILLHKASQGAQFSLPTKEDRFDWTLGPTVSELRDTYDADYALFVFVRDSYSTGGRVAAQILMAVLFGANLQGGSTASFASLVDLRTGDLAWLNVVGGAYDLRERGTTEGFVEDLFEELPR